jgi:tryptophan halogenase
MEHGWTWKIPMLGRHGTGHGYSSKCTDQDYATNAFLNLHGSKENDVNLNHIKFRTGRNRRAWVKNCVAIGLSSCFLEPLESTGIYFITASIYQLAKHFPGKQINPTLRDAFNREVEFMYDDCKDFIQAHYFNSDRDDSEFWLANKNALFLGDSMQEKMALYKAGLPVNPPTTSQDDYYGSFDNEFHNFWTNGSYYCIFAGMGFYPDESLARIRYRDDARNKARELFKNVQIQQQKLVSTLPTNYEYLKTIHAEKKSGDKSPALEIAWGNQVRNAG